jgi:hypothetical protein
VVPLEAAPMLGRGFEHQTKGFILSIVTTRRLPFPIASVEGTLCISRLAARLFYSRCKHLDFGGPIWPTCA